jgi:hypothetical protein
MKEILRLPGVTSITSRTSGRAGGLTILAPQRGLKKKIKLSKAVSPVNPGSGLGQAPGVYLKEIIQENRIIFGF